MKNEKKQNFVLFILLLLYWGIMSIVPTAFPQTGKLLADYFDIAVYFRKGGWAINHLPAISEYPPIATLLFGLNRLLVSKFPENLQWGAFLAVFSLGMILVLFFTIKALAKSTLIKNPAYAWLMLLPPVVYFSYSRFDILPAFLTLWAYAYAREERWKMAGFILSVATFTKWYPILLLPGFFVYATMMKKRMEWSPLVVFVVTTLVIHSVVYWQGGWDAIVSPYLYHTRRGMESIAFPRLIYLLLSHFVAIKLSAYLFVFFVLQILFPVLLMLFAKIDSLEALAHYGIVVIGMFILCSRIWSPQWFLWIMPLLILTINKRIDVFLIILFSFVVFASFPIAHDICNESSCSQLTAVGLVYYAMLFFFIVRSLKALRFPTLSAVFNTRLALR